MRKVKLAKKEDSIETISESEIIPIQIDQHGLVYINKDLVLCNRLGGSFKDAALLLDSDYDWEIIEDETEVMCLICKPKK